MSGQVSRFEKLVKVLEHVEEPGFPASWNLTRIPAVQSSRGSLAAIAMF